MTIRVVASLADTWKSSVIPTEHTSAYIQIVRYHADSANTIMPVAVSVVRLQHVTPEITAV